MKNREGSFKERYVNSEALGHEANILSPIFQNLKQELLAKKLNEAQFVSLYLLAYQFQRNPKNSIQGINSKVKNKNAIPSLKNFLEEKQLYELLEYFLKIENNSLLELSLLEIFELNFKGLPNKMNKAMIHWLNDSWSLKLFFHIPTAREILQLQKIGSRCVTALISKKSLSRHILGKRDTLSFVIHDLEHAVNFYQDENLKIGQIGFYHFIDKLLEEDWIISLLENSENENLHHLLDYVIADMNAYSVHLTKYLYGILKRFFNSSENLEVSWDIFLKKLNLPIETYESLKDINSPNMSANQVENLHLWFVSHGSQLHENYMLDSQTDASST